MIKSEFRQVTMTANGTADLMTTDATIGYNSSLLTAPEDGFYELRILSTDANVQVQVFRGSEAVHGLSPASSGGTIGVTPNDQNSAAISFPALQGDTISVQLRETAGGTPSVMASVDFIGA